MTQVLATRYGQARHYTAVRARIPLSAPTLEQRIVGVLNETAGIQRLMVQDVIKAASLVFDVPVADIVGRTRFPEHVRPRHVAMTICRIKLVGTPRGTSVHIGRVFDGRDHSCVWYALRKYRALVERVIRESATPLTEPEISA